MKLIERNSGRIVDIIMYMMDEDKMHHGNDISADFFADDKAEYIADGSMIVDDIDYCVDYAKEWVDGIGDFADEDGFHVTEKPGYRMAIINDELYTNYDIKGGNIMSNIQIGYYGGESIHGNGAVDYMLAIDDHANALKDEDGDFLLYAEISVEEDPVDDFGETIIDHAEELKAMIIEQAKEKGINPERLVF